MDLSGIELLKRRENVHCHETVKHIRIEPWKKWSPVALSLQRHEQRQNQLKSGQQTLQSQFATSARSRTAATALLLYISYTLSIHLLWTNCVIFTETAQLNLNINSSWTSLLHHQHQQQEQQQQQNRTESNRNLNSNNSYHNLKSNLGNGSTQSHCICVKVNGISNQSSANHVEFVEFSTNLPIFSTPSKFASSSSTPALSSKSSTTKKAYPAINVNRITVAGNQVVSRSRRQTKHFHIINQLKTTASSVRQFKINQLQPSTQSPIYDTPSHGNEQNEFKRKRTQISDGISFRKYQSERDNVIKSVKIHAIKRNVNTFTSTNLGHNSNLSVINAINGTHSKTIESSTTAMTTTTASVYTVSTALSTSTSKTINDDSTANISIHQNRTVTDDSKLQTNNGSTINRMESGRENNRSSMSNGTVFDNVTSTSQSPMPTKNPIVKHTSFNLPATNRLRVNDVFEMDTKRKFFNASIAQNENDDDNNRKQQHHHHRQQYRNGKRIISLLGLFELSTRDGRRRAEGFSELAAAKLAVQHINKREHLLSGYTLQLITNDTKVFWLEVD